MVNALFMVRFIKPQSVGYKDVATYTYNMAPLAPIEGERIRLYDSDDMRKYIGYFEVTDVEMDFLRHQMVLRVMVKEVKEQ